MKGPIPKYTCNAYLILGSWNSLKDVNTLVDIGSDGSIGPEIDTINTGVGKRAVEQIVITHEHFDHAGGMMEMKNKYKAKVLAFKHFQGVDELLKDGQIIIMGDREFEVIHMPIHSSDSICLYCRSDKVLFSGDTPFRIQMPGGKYPSNFIQLLKRLMDDRIMSIYSGHDPPIEMNAMDTIHKTFLTINDAS